MATRGWENATPSDVRGRRTPENRATLPSVKRSKYGAVKTSVDGIVFDSKAEAARYTVLKALESAGEIRGLKCQWPYELSAPRIYVAGAEGLKPRTPAVLGKYVADFIYYGKDGFVVEDVKGFKTPLYRWKKKHVEAQYGIQIREIR
jgi:hypothetical protein